MDYRAWINDLIGKDTLRVASGKIGLSHSTITRQLSRDTLTAPAVIALSRAYGRSPVDGLVETGYLRAEETEGVGVARALSRATNRELLAEILRRSDPDELFLFGITADVVNPRTDEVLDDDDGTVATWCPHAHAADDSEDEDEGRENAGSDPLD